MKKSDLKTGMRVTTRCGTVHIIMITSNGSYMVGSDVWDGLDAYNDDLSIWVDELCIDKVHKESWPSKLLDPDELGELIWERKKEEAPICTIDGVEYSESTLRSLIQKATQ